MDEVANLAAFPILGDADPVPRELLLSFPEQASTLSLLSEVSRELTSILDREELLRRIAQRVKRIVNYHVFSVLLWNERSQHLEGVFAMHYDNTIPARFRIPLHKGITGTAAAERRTLRINDVKQDSRFFSDEWTADIRSELVVPLLIQDRLIGVLDFESTAANAFTAEQERMLTILGSYIAIALENARLYEEARESQNRLQTDLDTAREIQRQLLPLGAREVPGLDLAAAYCPARALGGDFYDFLPYGEGQLAIALGDVSGKGTAAALYGSLAIGTLRELVVEHAHRPAQMLTMLNRRLLGARLDARFIAMLFAVYDAPSRRLTVSNAGSPYPLLVRNGIASEIRVEGVPLGLLADSAYEETSIDLRAGDIFLFASDGIIESENASEEQFGTQRLKSLLATFAPAASAAEIASDILSATDGHSDPGVPPHDDRTVIVLRATDETSSDYSKMPIIY